jgi:16S rRNA processing protein RimM
VSEQLIPLGEIVTTHGIQGWLKLKPYNPNTDILFSVREIFLERAGVRSSFLLEESRLHKSQFLLKLRGINRIAEAQNWVGTRVSVPEQTLHPLKPGEYYYYQTLGLDVLDLKGQWIGKITEIWSKEGGDLYVVRGTEKEHLIPAVKEMIEKVDFLTGKMIINPPDGLLDL